MSKIIPLHPKKTDELHKLGLEYDKISTKALAQDSDIIDVAGIMANRLGELIRIFEGDKERLILTCTELMERRAYYEKD